MAKYFEVTGNINKEETIHALNDYKLKNTFVVIDDKPYPGYHYHTIDARMVEKNTTIFLISKNRQTWASIIRATEKINKFLEEPIDASFSNLSLFNVPHYAIRIKGLKDMSELETIQKAYQEEGFVFMKNKRMLKPKTVFFKVKRFFDIKEIEKGFYKDKEGNAYIIINKKIEWELFRKMTLNVKRNISDNNFDVVNGAFYMNHTLVDLIRVFRPNNTLESLKEIKDEYQRQINKYF
jgi:hypothetical protein